MKRFSTILLVLALVSFAFAGGSKESVSSDESFQVVVASTSWTAAFADLAGVDGVSSIAPASLRHPPEYEVTVSDIEKIHNADFFIYAGFERMMKTLGDAVGKAEMIQIVCDNSIETVKKSAAAIAEKTGSQKECGARVAEYIKVIEDGKASVEKKGLKGAKVLCNKNQTYLAKDLGFEIAATFGPGPVTSDQIADAKASAYDFIIDNVHNPVGSLLVEVSPSSKYIVWRNFPETVERNALIHVVQDNIDTLLK